MRFPRFLTAALLASACAVPSVHANTAGAEAPAASMSPAPAAAPEAATAPAQPAATNHAGVPAAPAAAADPAAAHAAGPAAPAAAAAEAKPEAVAANDEDPIVCRSQVETGTIGRKQKVCMTKSQWEAQRQAARRFKRSVDQSRSTQPGGGG